jgi:hypothetical protein
MPAFTMWVYLAEDRQNSISIGLFQNNGYLYPDFSCQYMRPDYSHKIFDDKRLHRFFFLEALARGAAFA